MTAMRNLLKAGFGLAALTLILSSCNTVASAPDGSGSLVVTGLRTDLKDQNNNYVACDSIVYGYINPPYDTTTNVATSFTLSGSINSASVGLRGDRTTRYDSNYNATFSGQQLATIGGNNFKASFSADSRGTFPGDESGFLPQNVRSAGINVNPVGQNIKVRLVTTDPSNLLGSFHALVSVNTSTNQNFSAISPDTNRIPVYSLCTYFAPSNEDL